MKKFFKPLIMVLLVGCSHAPTIKQAIYKPYLEDRPLSTEDFNKVKNQSPKDAVFADLLQAFALMRTGDLNNKSVRQNISNLLKISVDSFEDMRDPVNFSKAFSADESKDFRGRPHERMFAATMAGVFLMADNQCEQALPYLRNAEFLDARFQKMPFGTDAPLIYALMYRCLEQKKADASDIKRASDGVYRSVRFLSMQSTFIKALVDMAKVDLRPMAVVNRLAYMIYEISIYHSLITAPNNADANQLVDDAAKNASIFISSLSANFADEYQERMKPLVIELARVYGMNSQDGIKHLEAMSFDQISLEVETISKHLKKILNEHSWFKKEIAEALNDTENLTAKILKAARAPKMILSFTGHGPTLVREGSYDQISVIKPSPDAKSTPTIREKDLKLSTACGFHRLSDGGFSVVMCFEPSISTQVESMPALELLSLSRKATTAQGRKFDKVLKGRAQFKAATEQISEVTAWSAFFLFILGADIIADCNRRGQSQACHATGLAVWAVAGVTAIFSGTVWLIGKTVNPSADSRFIHLMYESAWLSV